MAKLYLKKISLMLLFGFAALFAMGIISLPFGFIERIEAGDITGFVILTCVCAAVMFVTVCVLRMRDIERKTAYMVNISSVRPCFLKRLQYILGDRELLSELAAESSLVLVVVLYVAFTGNHDSLGFLSLLLTALTVYLMLTVPFFIVDVVSWMIVHSVWTRYMRPDETEKIPRGKLISFCVCLSVVLFAVMCVVGFTLSAGWLLLLSPVPLVIGCLLVTYYHRFKK